MISVSTCQHNDFFKTVVQQRSIKESTKQGHVTGQITKHLKQLGFLKTKHLIKKRLYDVHPLFKICVCVSVVALYHEVFVLFVLL